MPTFPFTFTHAGRDFTVVIGGRGAASFTDPHGPSMVENGIYYRVGGQSGLQECGIMQPDDTVDAIQRRIARVWDERHPA